MMNQLDLFDHRRMTAQLFAFPLSRRWGVVNAAARHIAGCANEAEAEHFWRDLVGELCRPLLRAGLDTTAVTAAVVDFRSAVEEALATLDGTPPGGGNAPPADRVGAEIVAMPRRAA